MADFDILFIYINEFEIKFLKEGKIVLSIDIMNSKVIKLYEYAVENKKEILFSHDEITDMLRDMIATSILIGKMPKVLVKETEKFFNGKENYYAFILDTLIKTSNTAKINNIFKNIKINLEKYLCDNVTDINFSYYLKDIIYNIVDVKNLQYIPQKIKSLMETNDSYISDLISRNVFGFGLNGNIFPTLNVVIKTYFNGKYTTKETFAEGLIVLLEQEKYEPEIDKQIQIIMKTYGKIVTDEEIIQTIKERAKKEIFEKFMEKYNTYILKKL